MDITGGVPLEVSYFCTLEGDIDQRRCLYAKSRRASFARAFDGYYGSMQEREVVKRNLAMLYLKSPLRAPNSMMDLRLACNVMVYCIERLYAPLLPMFCEKNLSRTALFETVSSKYSAAESALFERLRLKIDFSVQFV